MLYVSWCKVLLYYCWLTREEDAELNVEQPEKVS